MKKRQKVGKLLLWTNKDGSVDVKKEGFSFSPRDAPFYSTIQGFYGPNAMDRAVSFALDYNQGDTKGER